MIRNEREYKSTKAALFNYQDAIAKFDILKVIEQGVDPIIAEAQRSSYERQISELAEQVESFEALKAGTLKEFVADDVMQMGRKLVEVRVAKGLTQREMASLAGLKEQQIQRYEKEQYASASLRRIAFLSSVLGARFSGEFSLQAEDTHPEMEFLQGLNPSNFPISEMNRREWFDRVLDIRTTSDVEKKRLLGSFFMHAGMTEPSRALHRKSKGQISVKRTSALTAWQARVLSKARSKAGLARRFTPLPPEVIRRLAQFSALSDGPVRAVELLLEYGIVVLFEKHLSGTKLDGAAMTLDGKYAVIGMTIRYDRIDNFWFVLFHELGHVMRHWGPLLRQGFLDEEGDDFQDRFEKEANEFALNSVVPQEEWDNSLVRFTQFSETVAAFSKKRGVHPALIAGRIQRERDSYQQFSELLGRGAIRAALQEAGLLE